MQSVLPLIGFFKSGAHLCLAPCMQEQSSLPLLSLKYIQLVIRALSKMAIEQRSCIGQMVNSHSGPSQKSSAMDMVVFNSLANHAKANRDHSVT